MRYHEELISQIKQENDIVDVISNYVSLKKGGANYKGLCPFHSEKTPSFTVNPAKQIFHCFGC
ncbi:MAG: CHC2 zinc finger domain-containing protein, partial [bacterium]|nr:CHC2 zinc finger domain-containing protein [bacterium]